MSQLFRCTQQLSTLAETATHMDAESIYLHNAVRPKERVLHTVAGPRGQSRVVYQHQVPYVKTGRTPRAVMPS